MSSFVLPIYAQNLANQYYPQLRALQAGTSLYWLLGRKRISDIVHNSNITTIFHFQHLKIKNRTPKPSLFKLNNEIITVSLEALLCSQCLRMYFFPGEWWRTHFIRHRYMQSKASLDQLQDYRLPWNEEKKREGIMPRKHEKKHFHLTVMVS